jgi:hypothetical protein
MALVEKISHQGLQKIANHTKVECTYDIIQAPDGTLQLQLDTYGSAERQILDKKSQSIRLSQTALQDLKAILAKHNL